ncbi:MAG: dienelactone hydrolase family protein [Deltaproteobacteria bacterium]|jgi:dienelactone hydrolase|nr:dienelactone hydrolase family protein [Deltaproteobacteria bacterium]
MRYFQEKISYPAGDVTVPGYLCLPQENSGCAPVIIFHGSDGFKPNHEMIAHQLAMEGFAALALTWFGGDSARSVWGEVRADDILQAVAFLKRLPAVDTDRLGLIGFSRGGGLAMVMASLIPQTRAVVNYFGLTSWTGGLEEFAHLPLNKSNPLDFIRHLACPVLSFHGKSDEVVPASNTIEVDTACIKFGIDHHYTLYPGVNHSFIWPGDKYNQAAHQDSWERTLEFFRNTLK